MDTYPTGPYMSGRGPALDVSTMLRFSKTEPDMRPGRLNQGRWVRIDRGVYMDTALVPADLKPWEVSRLVAEARLLAVAHRFRASRTPQNETAAVSFTAASALVAAGLGTWERNPGVTVRVSRPQHLQTRLPAASLHGQRVEGVPVKQTTTIIKQAPTSYNGTSTFGQAHLAKAGTGGASGNSRTHPRAPEGPGATVSHAPWHTVIRDLAATGHPLAAFVNACTILRHYTAFDRFWLEECLEREATYKWELRRDLGDFAGARGARTLRGILQHATGAAESQGESALLWHLHCLLHPSVRLTVQEPVFTEGRIFYLDAAIPSKNVGFEFDGVSKFATSNSQWSRQTQGFLERQNLLVGAGWMIIRLTWNDVVNSERTFSMLRQQLEPFGVCRDQPGGLLYRSPSSPPFREID